MSLRQNRSRIDSLGRAATRIKGFNTEGPAAFLRAGTGEHGVERSGSRHMFKEKA